MIVIRRKLAQSHPAYAHLWVLLVFFCALLTAVPAQAILYQVPVDRSSWELDASPFVCRLTHPIPDYGMAVLERSAGSAVRFWFQPMQTEQTLGSVRVYTERPSWLSGGGASLITAMEVRQPIARIEVEAEQASRVLSALEQGLQPTLRVDGHLGSDRTKVVAASPANFRSAYEQYQNCVAGLLPVNYEQIARTAILYPPSQWELSEASKRRLDLVYQYVSTDTGVTRIYIDGHSDSSGRRLINRDLSRKRAEAVTEYLTRLGMSEEMLVTRYHGERYPVVPNTTAENRTRNRRVTIRLEREG